jgi:hypothetical protein
MRKLTVKLMVWSATSMAAGVELDFAIADDVLRKGKQKLTSSRAPLHDSFRQDDQQNQALLLDQKSCAGVVLIGG